ncbi:MAG: DUF4258 domain-containing protein [Spirochaetales bacterium]|nr:DUF4258 domain-containing protein [Spirochaetales bacterium]
MSIARPSWHNLDIRLFNVSFHNDRALTVGATTFVTHGEAVIQEGERIIDYREDRPFPSALMLADVGGRPLHVVVAFDKDSDMAYVITAYEPTTEEFEEDLRTRRKRK